MTIQWNEANEAVNSAASILIVTHVSPDGDAIGSLLGLANALRERGKTVTTAVDGGVPQIFQFLQNANAVASKLETGDWDLLISVDASDEPRTGLVGAFGRAHSKKVINLDHHATNTYFGDIFIVMPQAVSATEIIFYWLREMQHPVTPEVATALMTGLLTDTIGLRTNNVHPSTLAVGQQLMDAGAPMHDIIHRVLDSKPYSSIVLWREALQTMELTDKVISAVITQQHLKTAGIKEMTDSGLVGILIGVNEALIAVVFKETAEGRVELSMRAKSGWDVSALALSLGGGGHKVAAGATIDGPIDAAKARVLPLLQAIVKGTNGAVPQVANENKV
jgi:bifunctional oligoribonuclease and PAP phosphatase NrnA